MYRCAHRSGAGVGGISLAESCSQSRGVVHVEPLIRFHGRLGQHIHLSNYPHQVFLHVSFIPKLLHLQFHVAKESRVTCVVTAAPRASGAPDVAPAETERLPCRAAFIHISSDIRVHSSPQHVCPVWEHPAYTSPTGKILDACLPNIWHRVTDR